MKIFIALIVTILLQTGLQAQQKVSFSSQNYIGLLAGESKMAGQVQTINGIKIDKWFTGIGTGIDWYYLRSIPLFASVNRSFLSKGKRSFLATADLGINFAWRGNEYYFQYEPTSYANKAGFYWATGAGYKFGVGKSDNAILFQLGYTYKKLRYTYTTTYPCLTPPCPEDKTAYNYYLNRLSFKVGWGF